MFLQTILKEDKNSFLNKFYMAQSDAPSREDWSIQVRSDLEEFKISLSLHDIKNLSVDSFRNKVKIASKVAAFEWLMNEKKENSKVMDMAYKKYQMQEYLVSSLLETREKKFLFQLRLRMLNVKTNFRNSVTDLSCPLCKHEEDTQKHLLRCPFLSTNQPVLSNPEYAHIFDSDVNKQINITRIFMGLWKMRKKMVKK